MADEPDNLVLQHLRRIDRRVERLTFDVQDLKIRILSVEEGLAGGNCLLDRLEARVERIERRLDLVDVPH